MSGMGRREVGRGQAHKGEIQQGHTAGTRGEGKPSGQCEPWLPADCGGQGQAKAKGSGEKQTWDGVEILWEGCQ